jgi:chromosome segregation ATPase
VGADFQEQIGNLEEQLRDASLAERHDEATKAASAALVLSQTSARQTAQAEAAAAGQRAAAAQAADAAQKLRVDGATAEQELRDAQAKFDAVREAIAAAAQASTTADTASRDADARLETAKAAGTRAEAEHAGAVTELSAAPAGSSASAEDLADVSQRLSGLRVALATVK